MDLTDINFTSGVTSATYSAATGKLTVTDGTHTSLITLSGAYQNSQFTVANDGSGKTAVTVEAAPVVRLNGTAPGNNTTASYIQVPTVIAPTALITDADSANMASMSITLTSRPDGDAAESLSLDTAAQSAANAAGLSVSYTASSGVLSIFGSAPIATYQTILEGIQYTDNSLSRSTSPRFVNVVINDGAVNSVLRTVTIEMPPQLSGTLAYSISTHGWGSCL